MSEGGAIGTVVRATADSDICALTLALGQIPRARRELDGAEAELIAAARAVGLSWARIATALGLGSPQGAEQRSVRLAAAGAGADGRDVASWRRARGNSPTGPDPTAPDADISTPAGPLPTREPVVPAALERFNEPLKPDGGGRPPTRASSASGSGPAARIPLTSPGVIHANDRRTVTAADFTADPIYNLERSPNAGLWHVHALGEVIGRVQRQGSRWAAFTVTGTRIGTRTHSSRAQAAFEVVTEHRAHQTRKPRRRHRR